MGGKRIKRSFFLEYEFPPVEVAFFRRDLLAEDRGEVLELLLGQVALLP